MNSIVAPAIIHRVGSGFCFAMVLEGEHAGAEFAADPRDFDQELKRGVILKVQFDPQDQFCYPPQQGIPTDD